MNEDKRKRLEAAGWTVGSADDFLGGAIVPTMTPTELLRRPYARVLIPESDGRFSARILELPGCFAQGNTLREAYANLEAAALAWLQVTIEQGLPVPLPRMMLTCKRPENVGIDNPPAVDCPCLGCQGTLQSDGRNVNGTLTFLLCSECRCTYRAEDRAH